jgi:hypothetical protein
MRNCSTGTSPVGVKMWVPAQKQATWTSVPPLPSDIASKMMPA